MALWIIGGILLLLILLLLLRVGVHLRFGEQLELTVIGRSGPHPAAAPAGKDGDRAKDQAEEKSQGRSTGEEACQAAGKALSELRRCPLGAAVPVEGLKRALARTRRRMRIDPLRLSVVFAGRILLPWRRPMAGPAAPCGR